MNCSHPVIYTDKDGKYCHVCGARLNAEAAAVPQAEKKTTGAEKPQETAKKAAAKATKRTVKTKAD